MKFKINATVRLDANMKPDHLKQIIEPENTTVSETTINTSTRENKVITSINGTMSVGSLLRTIDDILQTASLADNVADTTE